MSESLERAKRNHTLGYTASREEVAALLAEVARLEQERDEAKYQRDNFERIARERAENAHTNWQARGAVEAELAVARKREQRLREKLERLASTEGFEGAGYVGGNSWRPASNPASPPGSASAAADESGETP